MSINVLLEQFGTGPKEDIMTLLLNKFHSPASYTNIVSDLFVRSLLLRSFPDELISRFDVLYNLILTPT